MDDRAASQLAITEVISRYCRALERMDRQLATTAFHPDATADYGASFQGTAAVLIENLWFNHAALSGHSHQVTNILIDVDGRAAGSESYALGTLWNITDDGLPVVLTALGRYLDQWSRRGGVRAIDHRRFSWWVHNLTASDHTGIPVAPPELEPNKVQSATGFRPPRSGGFWLRHQEHDDDWRQRTREVPTTELDARRGA
jgi:hypothetical protein